YTLVGGLFPIKNHLGEVTLEADGDGTLLRWRCEFESKIPGLGGLFRRMITKTFTGGLEGLEKHSFS
ncbi:MAG: SRPBCC family protein, partial [Myxococcota bacterium]